jgi:hypothetical protein
MFPRTRTRLTYANVTATLALFFAMTGGALAAGHYLITSTKQIKPSVLKQLQGKAGSAGAQGSPGPAGPAGAQGGVGANGKDGAPGGNGESVAMKAATGGECKEGGVAFTVASKTEHACNGEKGAKGSPWTAEGTLPAGASETGAWEVGATSPHYEGEYPSEPVSFPIALAEELDEQHVHVVSVEEQKNHTSPPACQGTVAEPTAESGSFCAYTSEEKELLGTPEVFKPTGATGEFPGGASKTGAILFFVGGPKMQARGTWAVTG